VYRPDCSARWMADNKSSSGGGGSSFSASDAWYAEVAAIAYAELRDSAGIINSKIRSVGGAEKSKLILYSDSVFGQLAALDIANSQIASLGTGLCSLSQGVTPPPKPPQPTGGGRYAVAWSGEIGSMLSGIAADSMMDRRIALRQCTVFHKLALIDPPLRNPAHCIDALQRFLIHRLEHTSVHAVVAAALREIDREHGCLPVADVAARCGVSARHLDRLMRLWVGYGPKRYASIVRFQSTLDQMQQEPGRSVAFLAAETGFFDQAHLTANVARFAGATPGHLVSDGVSDFSKTRCDDLP